MNVQWVRLPADFSAQPIALKVEQRFGLTGFARLVKLLELLAASPLREAGQIELSVSDWLESLAIRRDEFQEFTTYLTAAEWLAVEQSDEPGSPLRVTLLHCADLLPEAAGIGLFTKACQWLAWCTVELGMPRDVGIDPYVQQLFRRWCATNVTVAEAEQALQLAINRNSSMHPQAMHDALLELRKERVRKAMD